MFSFANNKIQLYFCDPFPLDSKLVYTVTVVILGLVYVVFFFFFFFFLDESNFSHNWVNQETFSKARLLNAGMFKIKDLEKMFI